MADRNDKTRKREFEVWEEIKRHFWLVLVCVLLIGAGQIATLVHIDFLSHVLRDLGVAAFVSIAIIVTVELRQRQELSETVDKFLHMTHEKYFELVLGHNFPPSIYNYVRDEIFGAAFYRAESWVTYSLSIPSQPKQCHGINVIDMKFEATHVVQNMTSEAQTYHARFFIERDPSDKGREIKLTDYSAELHIDGRRLTDSEMKSANAAWADDDNYVKFAYSIPLPAHGKVTTSIKNLSHTKLMSDTEVWRSVYPCGKLTFTVQAPPELEISVDTMHPDSTTYKFKSDSLVVAEISRPLLPHNGFVFWWAPRRKPQPLLLPPTTLREPPQALALGAEPN